MPIKCPNLRDEPAREKFNAVLTRLGGLAMTADDVSPRQPHLARLNDEQLKAHHIGHYLWNVHKSPKEIDEFLDALRGVFFHLARAEGASIEEADAKSLVRPSAHDQEINNEFDKYLRGKASKVALAKTAEETKAPDRTAKRTISLAGEIAELQKYWEEMRRGGGAMMFRNMRDIDLTREHFENALKDLSQKPLAQFASKWRHAVEALDTRFRPRIFALQVRLHRSVSRGHRGNPRSIHRYASKAWRQSVVHRPGISACQGARLVACPLARIIGGTDYDAAERVRAAEVRDRMRRPWAH